MPKVPKGIKVARGKEAKIKHTPRQLMYAGVPKKIVGNCLLALEQIKAGKKVFLGVDKFGKRYVGEMVLNAETGKYVPAIIIAEKK